MKRILPLAIVSLFFAIAGCGAGPEAPTTPESSALAQKLTHELRTSTEAPGAEPAVSAELTSTTGAYSNVTVIVRCNRRCIMACSGSDDFCSASCCEVIVR